MTQEIQEYDEEDDFRLLPAEQSRLLKFMQSKLFSPFLEALDKDKKRVALRLAKAKDVRLFKERTRFDGLNELSRWLGKTREEFDEDDFAHMPNPKIAIKYEEWEDAVRVVREAPGGEESQIGFLVKAVVALLSYTNKMQWKLDHLLGLTQQNTASKPASGYDAIIAKYPCLLQCDDHVKNVPNVAPLMLSRSEKVTSSSLTLCLCFFLHCYNFL